MYVCYFQWGYCSNTVVYSFTKPDRVEHCVTLHVCLLFPVGLLFQHGGILFHQTRQGRTLCYITCMFVISSGVIVPTLWYTLSPNQTGWNIVLYYMYVCYFQWGYCSNTVVYSFTKPDRVEHCVILHVCLLFPVGYCSNTVAYSFTKPDRVEHCVILHVCLLFPVGYCSNTVVYSFTKPDRVEHCVTLHVCLLFPVGLLFQHCGILFHQTRQGGTLCYITCMFVISSGVIVPTLWYTLSPNQTGWNIVLYYMYVCYFQWGYCSNTVVYSFTKPDRVEHCVTLHVCLLFPVGLLFQHGGILFHQTRQGGTLCYITCMFVISSGVIVPTLWYTLSPNQTGWNIVLYYMYVCYFQWGYCSNTVVYSFTKPDRVEHCVILHVCLLFPVGLLFQHCGILFHQTRQGRTLCYITCMFVISSGVIVPTLWYTLSPNQTG